ncbi:hypothetical protein E2R55_03160 [Vibrio vulnificus]|nr:hypothetical protein E2R55_03160 [Vibrio vulnificus]
MTKGKRIEKDRNEVVEILEYQIKKPGNDIWSLYKLALLKIRLEKLKFRKGSPEELITKFSNEVATELIRAKSVNELEFVRLKSEGRIEEHQEIIEEAFLNHSHIQLLLKEIKRTRIEIDKIKEEYRSKNYEGLIEDIEKRSTKFKL